MEEDDEEEGQPQQQQQQHHQREVEVSSSNPVVSTPIPPNPLNNDNNNNGTSTAADVVHPTVVVRSDPDDDEQQQHHLDQHHQHQFAHDDEIAGGEHDRDEIGSEIEEVQKVDQATTARAPEGSAVIRLTRQMSRVLSRMGSMSLWYEIRETKELQDLQERLHSLEKELKAEMMDYEILTLTFKEKEIQLMNKIECLELANEQLLAGGNDTSIQLQMELTRLQRQNSILSLRERELLFQVGTQQMLSQQMLNRTLNGPVVSSSETKHLEDKITVLESKLAQAVELSNTYKVQLHDAFDKQKNVRCAALLGLGDGDDVQKEIEKLRKQTKEQEVELQDLQDRFFLISVHLAESVAQREALLMKRKRINGYLKH